MLPCNAWDGLSVVSCELLRTLLWPTTKSLPAECGVFSLIATLLLRKSE
jgi:hypothetical protein